MNAALGAVAVLVSLAGCSSGAAHYSYSVSTTAPDSSASGSHVPLAALSKEPVLHLPRLTGLPAGLAMVPAPSACLLAAQVSDQTLGFTFNSSAISSSGRETLVSFIHSVVSRNRDFTLRGIHAEGYTSTDGPGERAYDQKLSDQRASAVAAVVRAALPQVKVTAHGSGENDPRYPNDTPAHRAANRRTVVTFKFSGCKS